MKIGVDIDDTMANFTEKLLDHYNIIFNENIKKSDIISWDVINNCNSQYKNLMMNITKTKNFYLDLELKLDVVEVLEYLIGLGHEIYIVGNPFHEFAIKDKYLWIKENLPFIKHENIIFTASKQLVNVDILIDDNPDNFNHNVNFNSDVNLVTIPILFDAPHNRQVEKYIRCCNWLDVRYLFKEFLNDKQNILKINNVIHENWTRNNEKIIDT